MEPEIRYTTTSDGVSIAFYAMGEGYPFVVTSQLLWSYLQIQPFREYHRSRTGYGLGRGLQVVRYDARGTGLSDRDAVDFSMRARMLDLDAVVERLHLTRFAMFGAIGGAPAAIAYAASHPDRVSHLILVDAYARGRDVREWFRAWDSLRDTKDWERYTLTVANTQLQFSDSESARKLAELYRESMTQESMRAFVTALEAIDVTSLLPRVAAPTLVVSRRSTAFPIQAEWAQQVARKIPDARFVRITPQDNFLWTDEETRLVEEFLGVNQQGADPAGREARPSPGRKPSAFRTVLFTDIVGHTEMMQHLGDAQGRGVLREHERITRETLKAHGGTEVKTMGDGFMASFESASSAMDCAIALQRAFASHTGSTSEPLHVRVGLNAGEPIEEDGDLFGSTVILASRIAAKAGAGEILVPESVRGLLSGKGFMFSDHGEFAPKGFDERVRLFEVQWRHTTIEGSVTNDS